MITASIYSKNICNSCVSAGELVISVTDSHGQIVNWFPVTLSSSSSFVQTSNTVTTTTTSVNPIPATTFTLTPYPPYRVHAFAWNTQIPSVSTTYVDMLTLEITHNDTLQELDSYAADVLGATDYYAFGAPMPKRMFNSNNHRYGFNGKENDNEVVSTGQGTQDYGARIYNGSLGRFLSGDMIANKFPWWSPYAFAGNTPIQALDLDGYEILNYKTPFRLREISGPQLTYKWELTYSWSEDFKESIGMLNTATNVSYGLAGKEYNPGLPITYPIYPGNGDNQVFYTLTDNEIQAIDFFGVGQQPGSASDATSNGTDGLAADRTKGQVYVATNRNKVTNDRVGAIAGTIEWGATQLFLNSNTMRSINAKADLNNMIQAYADATIMVEKFFDFSEVGKLYDWSEKQVDQFKADIINFVVDGKLPNGMTQEYNQAIENNGMGVINAYKEANAQKPLKSDDN